MRKNPSLNINIDPAPLHLFDKVSSQILAFLTLNYLTSLVSLVA